MREHDAVIDDDRRRVRRYGWQRAVVAAAMVAVSGGVRLAHADPCGDAPPVQFRASDNASIKGDLDGGAKFLSGWVGNAQLGGKISATKSEIYAKYRDANQAQMDRYFGYMFCKIIFDEKSNLSAQERLKALDEFRARSAAPPPPPPAPAPASKKAAPELSGTWVGQGPMDVAQVKKHFQYVYFPPANMTFHFIPNGDVLQGTMTLRKDDRFYTSTDYDYGLLEGKIDGNKISFVIRSEFAVNGTPKVAVERFSGRVEKDGIHFTVQEDTGYPPLQFTAIRAANP